MKIGLTSNHFILKGILFEIGLIAALMYVPFLQVVFGTTAITPICWLYLVLCPLPIVLLDELRKWFLRRAQN